MKLEALSTLIKDKSSESLESEAAIASSMSLVA